MGGPVDCDKFESCIMRMGKAKCTMGIDEKHSELVLEHCIFLVCTLYVYKCASVKSILITFSDYSEWFYHIKEHHIKVDLVV